MSLAIGEKLGPYEIISEHGQGGMATVYKAYHARLDRFVAIKVLHTAFLDDETFLARFEREARIIARLDHPNIVTVYDFDEVENRPYLVMQFIDGLTLKQRLIKKGTNLQETALMMTTLANALDYAHSRGVLHRDIKPSNILIDAETDTPSITDFGLARIIQLGESTISHDMMLGTPFYISPEQARGERHLDSRTDIYSMGVILYEMVTGQVPFRADTPYAIVHGHIYSPPPVPAELSPDIPEALNPVLLRALAKQASDRYETATEMMKAFNKAIGNERVDTPRPVKTKSDDTRLLELEARASEQQVQYLPPEKRKSSEGKSFQIEGSLDLGNLEDVSRQFETGVRKGREYVTNLAAMIGDRIESELESRSASSQEERIRERIELRMKKRQEFLTHVVVYVLVNALLWFLWRGNGFPWPIFPTVFWGIGLLSNGAEYYMQHGRGAARREEMIQREIEREMRRTQVYEKPKIDDLELIDEVATPRVRLNEEGELSDSFVEEAQQLRRRR